MHKELYLNMVDGVSTSNWSDYKRTRTGF